MYMTIVGGLVGLNMVIWKVGVGILLDNKMEIFPTLR